MTKKSSSEHRVTLECSNLQAIKFRCTSLFFTFVDAIRHSFLCHMKGPLLLALMTSQFEERVVTREEATGFEGRAIKYNSVIPGSRFGEKRANERIGCCRKMDVPKAGIKKIRL